MRKHARGGCDSRKFSGFSGDATDVTDALYSGEREEPAATFGRDGSCDYIRFTISIAKLGEAAARAEKAESVRFVPRAPMLV